MSAIETYLQYIASKVWARDVRTAIVNAIRQCYDDVHNPTLNTEALQAAIQAKIDAGQMAALTIGDRTITAAKLALGVIPTPDATLSQSGVPADAKKTGDEISAINESLDSQTKTVATTSEAVELCVVKSLKPKPEPTSIVQCVDLTTATRNQHQSSGNYYYSNVKIEFEWNGLYYINPFNSNAYLYMLKAYDKNGNLIQMYRNGNSFSSITIVEAGQYLERVDARTIKVYKASGALDWTYTFDADVAYLNGADSRIYTVSDVLSGEYGVTYGGSSNTYIPYGDSEEAETEDEYEYTYNTEMLIATKDYVVENCTDSEPTDGSDNLITSGAVAGYMLKSTYNLVDKAWFNWSSPVSGYVEMKSGIYVPVTAGETLINNAGKASYIFYDSAKTQLSTAGTALAYVATEIPANTAYMRIKLNAEYLPANNDIVVYYSEISASPEDDVRPYIVPKNLEGMRGSNEIFDYYAPTSLDKEIIKMAKYSAVRNMNFCNNILRIGTFNVYLPRGVYGWSVLKEMLKDCAVDIVGFQEVSGGARNRILTEYLKGWQFPYGSTNGQRAISSQFEILSTYVFNTSTNRAVMKCVIQLPRYGDRIDPTLSVYTYHGLYEGGSAQIRTGEINEILDVITSDTSDFIVIVGDTNSIDTGHPEYEVWRNAGYTPIHSGEVITTEDNLSIDNIFVSSGVTCKKYHVVPNGEYTVVISGQTLPLSDHDFIYADLEFDFDSLLN